jgi:hypothetical protein
LGIAGTHVCLTVIPAERIPQGVEDGTLTSAAEPASVEEQRWRYAFIAWDRIRTEEPDSWSCSLCERDYSGLRMLSALGVIDDPRTPGSAGPVDVALVCASSLARAPMRWSEKSRRRSVLHAGINCVGHAACSTGTGRRSGRNLFQPCVAIRLSDGLCQSGSAVGREAGARSVRSRAGMPERLAASLRSASISSSLRSAWVASFTNVLTTSWSLAAAMAARTAAASSLSS